MMWTNKHNEVLVQETYLFEPWNFKRGSKQRGQVWERISDSLNQYESPKFTVNEKSVRDHYIFLEKEQKKKVREEEKASGIAPLHTSFDESMAAIIQHFRETDAEDQQQDAEKRGKADEETAKAVEMRKSSMETFAQSKKRKGEQEQKKSKRFTGTETVAYLREKAELHALSLKREELQLRRAELDEKKVQQEGLMTQQENLTKMLCESIKSQQKQQEQLLQQMQLQNTALLTLLQGAVSKQKDT